jgi:hypothetical protein
LGHGGGSFPISIEKLVHILLNIVTQMLQLLGAYR